MSLAPPGPSKGLQAELVRLLQVRNESRLSLLELLKVFVESREKSTKVFSAPGVFRKTGHLMGSKGFRGAHPPERQRG